jgi:hypothetical protein
MTKEERAKVEEHFGTGLKGLVAKAGIPEESMRKRLHKWLAGKYSPWEVLASPTYHRQGRLEQKYGFDVERKARELGLGANQLRKRLRQVEAGEKTLADALLLPYERDINEGLSAPELARLAAMPGPGTWERQNL